MALSVSCDWHRRSHIRYLVAQKRDNQSAYAFIKRLIKQFDKPQIVIVKQAPSTKVAIAKVIKAFKLNPNCHCTSKCLNNLIEQDHCHIKVRKTKYQSVNTAKNTIKGMNVFTGYIKSTVGLFRSTHFLLATKSMSY